jgi:hypothetical protein
VPCATSYGLNLFMDLTSSGAAAEIEFGDSVEKRCPQVYPFEQMASDLSYRLSPNVARMDGLPSPNPGRWWRRVLSRRWATRTR